MFIKFREQFATNVSFPKRRDKKLQTNISLVNQKVNIWDLNYN